MMGAPCSTVTLGTSRGSRLDWNGRRETENVMEGWEQCKEHRSNEETYLVLLLTAEKREDSLCYSVVMMSSGRKIWKETGTTSLPLM